MKKAFLFLILTTLNAHASFSPVTLTGPAATKLTQALIQADLPRKQITAPNPKFPQITDLQDEKVSIANLKCTLTRNASISGALLGACDGVDGSGEQVRVGSAASAQIISALPQDGFGEGSTGNFTGYAKSIVCEIDARKTDPSTGGALTTCVATPVDGQ